MRKVILMMVVAMATLIACKKDSDSNASITGKWNLKTARAKTVSSSYSQDTTYVFSSGSYINFTSNGQVTTYGSVSGGVTSSNTGTYTLSSNNLTLIMSGGTTENYTVQTLTNNQLTLYNKQVNSTYTTESWINTTR